MNSFSPGAMIAHYRIREKIARGGMGEVYLAVDTRLERLVALKILAPDLESSSTARQRFLREARAASILSHPNIATIFEVGEAGDLIFIVMQYVKGRTIRELLAPGKPLLLDSALGYAVDVAEALEEAHRNGVVHRDIKPSNIIVNERNRGVVLDFGLAKRLPFAGDRADDAPTLSQLTGPATILGTAAYMSPEQVRGEAVGTGSDIFSFGALLFEMLAGRAPFQGQNEIEVMHAILHEEPPAVSSLRREADPRMDGIVQRALQKSVTERYADITPMKEDLLQSLRERGLDLSDSRIRSQWSSWISRPVWQPESLSARWVRALVVMIILGAGVVLGLWMLKLRNHAKTDEFATLSHVQLVDWKGEPGELSGNGSFSRDGTTIAFASTRGGNQNIWVKQIAGGNLIQATQGKSQDSAPVWSPDNQSIAFVSDRGGILGIWSVPALGGTPSLLTQVSLPRPVLCAWSKDGGRIYFEQSSNLFVLDVKTKRVAQKTHFDPSKRPPEGFSVSPAEDRIAYVDRKGGRMEVWVMPMNGGPAVEVTHDPEEDLNPVWYPDGKHIVYSSLRNGTYQICLASLDRRPPRQLTNGETDNLVSDVSADGSRILYFSSREESDLWAVSPDTLKELQVTSDIGVELWPEVSPSGSTLAYQATQSSSATVQLLKSFIMAKSVGADSQAGQAVQLASSGFEVSWSPKGDQLAFLRQSGNVPNLWTINAAGGIEKQLTTAGVNFDGYSRLPYNRRQIGDYSWSPDGTRIAYCSTRNGVSNVWAIATDGSKEVQLTDNRDAEKTLMSPLWSPDGRRLAYASRMRNRPDATQAIFGVSIVENGKPENIFQSHSALRLIGWSFTGREIIAGLLNGAVTYLPTAARIQLISIGLREKTSRDVASITAGYLYNIRLSPDGRRIAFASRQDGADNIWIHNLNAGPARQVTHNTDPQIFFSMLSWSPDGKLIYFGKQVSWSVISMLNHFN